MLNEDGIDREEEKIEAIETQPGPRTRKQKILGCVVDTEVSSITMKK